MYLPRSGFVIEGQREALERRGTWRELEGAADALRELALDARLLTVRARRACGQALELLVQCLRIFPVLQRERRAAGETACGTYARDTCLCVCLGVARSAMYQYTKSARDRISPITITYHLPQGIGQQRVAVMGGCVWGNVAYLVPGLLSRGSAKH